MWRSPLLLSVHYSEVWISTWPATHFGLIGSLKIIFKNCFPIPPCIQSWCLIYTSYIFVMYLLCRRKNIEDEPNNSGHTFVIKQSGRKSLLENFLSVTTRHFRRYSPTTFPYAHRMKPFVLLGQVYSSLPFMIHSLSITSHKCIWIRKYHTKKYICIIVDNMKN